MNIKNGDTVVVITGKDKGKTGKVLEVLVKQNRVIVEGVNVVSRHTKPKSAQEKGGIVKKPAPIDASNVMVMCSCGKATRVAHKVVDGKKVRICKACGMSLDKEHAKAVKKDAKKSAKASKVEEQEKTAEKKTTKTATSTKKSTAKTVKKTEE